MFREEATSTLTVFIQVLSPGRFGIWKRRSEQKIGEPAKTHISDTGWNRTLITFVGGEGSRHCAIPAARLIAICPDELFYNTLIKQQTRW